MGENKMKDNRYYREGNCKPAGLVLARVLGAWGGLEHPHTAPFIRPSSPSVLQDFLRRTNGETEVQRSCWLSQGAPHWDSGRLDMNSMFLESCVVSTLQQAPVHL